MNRFAAFRRRHWLLQFWLCNFGFHLWERHYTYDWCDTCQTPRKPRA